MLLIPVVISTNGLIYHMSVDLMKRNSLDIDWVSTIRKVIIRNMKNINKYIDCI